MLENISNNAKLIAIGEDGVNNLNKIQDKVKDNMVFETIAINQDVDKDYVRNLLDGVDILFLTYSTEDRRAKDILKAIGYMAKERRVLSIGLNSSIKEEKDELNIDRQLVLTEENTNKITSIMNMMIESISETCMINIDLTDLKEVLCSDKGIKYSYNEFGKDQTIDGVVSSMIDSMEEDGTEFEGKKGILFLDLDKNHCDESNMLLVVNELLTKIQDNAEDSYDLIFSLNVKENSEDNARIGLIYN
ncbi:MAG: cell division protein [Romboutsia sp.]|uniref:cell division protein n=1 Tax=Romboutsia sp. TaxID=1965302 RepID=UPI003F3E515D